MLITKDMLLYQINSILILKSNLVINIIILNGFKNINKFFLFNFRNSKLHNYYKFAHNQKLISLENIVKFIKEYKLIINKTFNVLLNTLYKLFLKINKAMVFYLIIIDE